MSEPLLEVRGLCKQFAVADGAPIEVLRGIDLEIGAGERVAIVGPPGWENRRYSTSSAPWTARPAVKCDFAVATYSIENPTS